MARRIRPENQATPSPVFPLRLSADERLALAGAVAASGGAFTTIGGFIRAAAIGQAQAILEKKTRSRGNTNARAVATFASVKDVDAKRGRQWTLGDSARRKAARKAKVRP
jgi:uncharacterized protein (DUF1778 family)